MAKRLLTGALIAGLALAGVKAKAEGMKEAQSILQGSGQNSEKITTIRFPSERRQMPGELNYQGVPFDYDVHMNLSASETKNSDTQFLPMWFYDIDGDGKFGKAEEDAIKAGIPIFMGNNFDEVMRAIYTKEITIKDLDSRLKEQKLTEDYTSLKSKYDLAVKELGELKGLVAKLQTPARLETEKPEVLPEIEINKTLDEKTPEELYLPEIPSQLKEKKAKGEKGFYLGLTGGLDFSGRNSSLGGELGLRFINPEKPVNFAILGTYQKGLKDNSETFTEETSPAGLYSTGTINRTGFQSAGLDASLYAGSKNIKGVLGVGYKRQSWTRTDTIETRRGDRVLTRNTSLPEIEYDNIVRGYLGGDFGNENCRLEGIVGFDYPINARIASPFVALRGTIALVNKSKQKE